jgi:hypothetical protein
MRASSPCLYILLRIDKMTRSCEPVYPYPCFGVLGTMRSKGQEKNGTGDLNTSFFFGYGRKRDAAAMRARAWHAFGYG